MIPGRRPAHTAPDRHRDEAGAVAVMTAVLASLLLITAALSVDLGNAWARKRDLQTQVDVSALSAGNWGKDNGKLPATTSSQKSDLASKVAEYMLKSTNVVIGQDDLTQAQLAGDLLDGAFANGELVFSADGREMQVVAPGANVNFGLAGVFGYTDVDVQASATVSLLSELPGTDVLPFWLPDGCAYGPVDGDTSNGEGGGSGGGGGGGGGGSGVNESKAGDFAFAVLPATAAAGQDGVVLTFTVPGTVDTKKTPEVFFEKTDGTETTAYDFDGTWTVSGGPGPYTFTITVGSADVTQYAGDWRLQVKVHNKYSTIQTYTVTGDVTGPIPLTCTGSDRGNFGQLKSPRAGSYNHQRELALNIAEGLDHQLVPYPDAPSDNCEKPSPLPAAQLDDTVRDGNNCIQGSTGNDGPWIYDGLIAGVEGKDGRLNVSRGATKAGCNGGNTTIDGKTLNNDLLSCYLEDGFSLSDLIADTAHDGMLDPSVTDSPRFVWMPVVYATDRSIKDFQPLLKFVPGFITDETAGTNSSSNATSSNGVEVNGNGSGKSVSALKVFTFHPNALQESDRSPVTAWDPDIQRDTLRLTD